MDKIKSSHEVYAQMDSLVESWNDRISLVEQVNEEPISYDRKIVLAQCLENTQQAINMLEATDSGDTDGFKRYALDLVTAIIPNLVANDIVSIQPISNEVGVINYIRYLYGNTKGAAKAGDEFASGILYTGSDPYYSSEEVVGEGLVVTPGAATAGTITGNLAWKPIIKGSLRIPVQYKKGADSMIGYVVDTAKDGTLTLVDSNDATVEGGLGTATINYESGAISIAMGTGVTLEANSTTLANYRYNNKSIGDGAIGTNALTVPEVDIKIETMPVICQSRKLKALYAFDAAFKLQKEYGTDINALLNSQIASEISHEIDAEIMNDLLTGAGLVNDSWSAERPEGISLADHYRSFNTVMIKGSNKIFGATKRAVANFMIVGLDVATIVESMDNFVPSGARNVIGPHISGTIGNVTVIKNPYYPAKKYVLGYKGMSLFDAGFFYCPYMPITTTQLVMLDDFVGRRGWASSYAKKMVQPLLYCRGEITD
jgi:hypothetical protein